MYGCMDVWMDCNLNLCERFQNVIIQEAVIHILKKDYIFTNTKFTLPIYCRQLVNAAQMS